MYLLIRPTGDLDDAARQRLQDRIRERLEQHGTNADIKQHTAYISLEAEEDIVPDLATSLARTPGIETVIPCMRTDDDPDAILDGVDAVLDDRPVREVQVQPGDSDLEERLTEHVDQDETGERLTVRVLGHAFIATEELEGIGGQPIDRDTVTVIPLRHRLDVYAGYLLMQDGHSITPISLESEADRVQEGIDTLQAYDPAVKLAAIDEENWKDGIEQAATAFGAEYVGLGSLPGDSDRLTIDADVTVERPLPAIDEAEALERYWEITVPGIDSSP